LEGEKEINYIITQKRRKYTKRDTKPVTKKEQAPVNKSTYSLGENFLDQETIDKLKGLKDKLN
jgi:hypothetical protein